MIGVVLWTDKIEKKAVFWCEDQGDLAFYDASIGIGRKAKNTELKFEVGDMVRFDVVLDAKLRRARDPSIWIEGGGSDLPDQLRKNAGLGDGTRIERLNVISFKDHARSNAPVRLFKKPKEVNTG